MNRKRVWRLCTLLPDLPGDSEVASTESPALRGNSCDDRGEMPEQECTVQCSAVLGKDEVIHAR